jgi:hypothetical protein
MMAVAAPTQSDKLPREAIHALVSSTCSTPYIKAMKNRASDPEWLPTNEQAVSILKALAYAAAGPPTRQHRRSRRGRP